MFNKKTGHPLLVNVQKIWNSSQHNALTDLIIFNNKWLCVFREGESHVDGRHGKIRILKSTNGVVWSSAALIQLNAIDLRDPKLSITPDGRLMLLIGGAHFSDNKDRLFHQSYVTFSKDGRTWESLTPVLSPYEWLWRVTWFQGEAYGISYRFSNPQDREAEWIATLWKSQDGIDFSPLVYLQVPGYPNEGTIRFTPEGKLVVLLRREEVKKGRAWLGISYPPYEDWLWKELLYYFGGPNFIILPNKQMWAAGRLIIPTFYGLLEKTVLASLTEETLVPTLILPSGGDCSYPGMVYHEGFLYLSYYSSHEGNAAIYLAKIDLPAMPQSKPLPK